MSTELDTSPLSHHHFKSVVATVSVNPVELLIPLPVDRMGHHYIFTNDYVIRTHFDSKGIPHIQNLRWYQPNKEWFPTVKLIKTNTTETGVLDASQPKAALLTNGVITVMKDGRFYQFDKPGHLQSYDATCDGSINARSVLHPLYCEIGQGQLIDATISNARSKDARDPEIKAFFLDEGIVYEKNYAVEA